MKEIINKLNELKDEKYAEFQRKLIPNIEPDSIIGVRTPVLKAVAREVMKDRELSDAFIAELPHKYFEENQLHSFIISGEKDFSSCVEKVGAFLPYVDNWASCDQLNPRVFKRNAGVLLPHIYSYIESGKTYSVRFGVLCLMRYFLDEKFKTEYLDVVAGIRSEEYYVNMMLAWYMATALCKQWDSAVKVIEENRLDKWVHNKSIQKALESFRVSADHKEYLKTLRR